MQWNEGAVLLQFSMSPFMRQGFNPPIPRTAEKVALSVFLPREGAHLLALRYAVPQHSHNTPDWNSQLEPTQLKAPVKLAAPAEIRV